MSVRQICANCGHGVSAHEWEDETTSCCMFHVDRLWGGIGEGKPCMCPGYKPSPEPQKSQEGASGEE